MIDANRRTGPDQRTPDERGHEQTGEERRRRGRRLGPVGQAAGLARIGAAAWWRTTIWTAAASVRVGSRVMRAAAPGQPPAELFRSARAEVQRLRPPGAGDRRPRRADSPGGLGDHRPPRPLRAESNGAPRPLREIGAELLRRSADVNFEEEAHPAYARILEDLAPDEGRILRLLALEGPQPSVDIRSGCCR